MTRHALGLFALLALAAGCAPSARHLERPTEPGAIEEVAPSAEAEKLLRDVARAATSAGAEPLRILRYGSGTPGDRVEALLAVPKDTCALFVARATPSIQDLDLIIYGDDGSQFAIDESPDDLPTLLVCPQAPRRLYASARVAQGRGLIALGVHAVAASRATSVAKAVGARDDQAAPSESEAAWPGLTAAIDERRRALGGKWLDQRRVAVPMDARVPTRLTVEVPANRCLDVLVLPSRDLSQVQLTAADSKGRIFARGQKLEHRRALLLCSAKEAKTTTLELRPYAGRGIAVAAVSASREPYSSLAPDPGSEVHFVDRGGPASDLEQLPPANIRRSIEATRGTIHSTQFELHGCSRLDLIPEEGLFGYEVWAWNTAGSLLGEASGQQGLPLFICENGSVRVDVEGALRSGTLQLQLRHQIEAPKALMNEPLAASRLLGLVHSRAGLRRVGEIGQVQELSIEDTHLHRHSLSIVASHCQTVYIAGGHGAVGIEARIVDEKTGLELDRAVGHTELVVSACARRAGHLNATLEVRTTSGQTTALRAIRQHKLEDASQ